MGVAAHDRPVRRLDVTEEKPLFFRACPGLRRLVGVARNISVDAGGHGEGKGRHGRLESDPLARVNPRPAF